MHISEEQLILYYYGEAAEDLLIEDHLASCAACRSEYRKLQSSLALLIGDDVPEPEADFGARVWQRMQPSPSVRRRSYRLFGILPLRSVAWVGAVAVLVFAAFVLGRYWPRAQAPAPLPQAGPFEPTHDTVLLAALADHLEEAAVLLTELSHAAAAGTAEDQALARELLKSNRIYRQAAVRHGETGLASVLDDLELILTDIAHSPSGEDARLQSRFDAILFELRVLNSQMRERQRDAARELSRRST